MAPSSKNKIDLSTTSLNFSVGLSLLVVITILFSLMIFILPSKIDNVLGQKFESELLPNLKEGMRQLEDETKQQLVSKKAEAMDRADKSFAREKTAISNGMAFQLLPLAESFEYDNIATITLNYIEKNNELTSVRFRTESKGKWKQLGEDTKNDTLTFNAIAKSNFAYIEIEATFKKEQLNIVRQNEEQSFQTLITQLNNSTEKTLSKTEKQTLIIQESLSSEVHWDIIFTAVISAIVLLLAIFYLLNILAIKPLNIVLERMKDVAEGEGDLTQRLPDFGKNEIGQIATAFNSFITKIQTVLIEVSGSVHHISTAANQVNSTAQALSQGSSEQAASVEETSASLEEMSASISQNTDNARATDTMASKAAVEALQGGTAVAETVSAMTEIASKISLIEDIAYKTNLLALNAAIEAARAGEHGKGFAVVADEVRKLAERSQISSQEISELAANSVTVAQRAGNLLEEIVPSIQETANLVMEISASSEEQSVGVVQVNQAIEQLDRVSQQNAAASEELAATSDEMSDRTHQLQKIISFFTLDTQAKKTDVSNNIRIQPSVHQSHLSHLRDTNEDDFISFNKSK